MFNKSSYSIILITVIMFILSCTNTITNCNHKQTEMYLPLKSFIKVNSITFYKDKDCPDGPCNIKFERYHGSGSFIYRSTVPKYKEVGFVLTAKHICDKRNLVPDKGNKLAHRFIIIDFFGREHEARFYLESEIDDACILIINDMHDDLEVSEISDSTPKIGSEVFNVAAPRGFFMPGSPLIFSGIYSGPINLGELFTIASEQGSSGSPVYTRAGKVISMIYGYPIPPGYEVTDNVRVITNSSQGVGLTVIRNLLQKIKFRDDVIKLTTITSTVN